jgi:glycosyltransferase involved in cell wall biosynthesis
VLKRLRQTLRALLELDYPREQHEIMVVDDGSGDNTPQVVAEIAHSHRM